ncbi:MAG: single-stranded-DNA-specific exonuclease RecJ [Patescibacteria group bacterium]|jgi:single-stranded-DNA-specific exonuclease
MQKKWLIAAPPPSSFLAEHPELLPIACTLLWNRGLRTTKQIDEFLNPDYLGDIHDPFLFKDMKKAIELIFNAIKKGEKITVHGDYDADGVCASAIIITTLKKLGCNNYSVFIPHREIDGYGLNKNTIKFLNKEKTNLIITCDCGISNTAEVALAKELGMNVIITDHHAMPAIFPPADAIIHPLVPGETYPDRSLSGGGVAFKLIQALLIEHHKNNDLLPDGERHEAFEKWLLDLVSISTVADMVPLIGESRTLVRYGLTVLNKSRNAGLRKLLAIAGLLDENDKPKRTFNTETIGFQIAPRINAAGRMDHANFAYALLMAETNEKASELADQLQQNNIDRQKLTEKLLKEARKQIKKTEQENNPIIFIEGENWSAGILGLVASKLKDEFYKPILVMGVSEKMVVASGRSVPGFNIIANLQALSKYLEKFGGHPQACGFSILPDKLPAFKEAMLEKAKEGTKDLDLSPQLKIDAEVSLEDVSWKLYDILQKFEPFGTANDEPVYAARGLTVTSVETVGKDNKHLRLMVKHNSHIIRKTIAFGFGNAEKHPANWSVSLKPGDIIDLAFSVSVNEWNGNRELQLMVKDIIKNIQK